MKLRRFGRNRLGFPVLQGLRSFLPDFLRISTPTRIAIGLTSLVLVALLAMAYLGYLPDTRQAVLEGRCALCEAVAVQCCLSAQRDDVTSMKTLLAALVSRNQCILSAAIRRRTGTVLAEVGDHVAHWRDDCSQAPPGSQIRVPVFRNNRPWGSLEVRFQPIDGTGWWNRTVSPTVRLLLLVACYVFILQRLYMKRILRYLDPAAVVPKRVRAALDALTEGVVILDREQQVVLANRAFAEQLRQTPEQLQGFQPSRIDWSLLNDGENHHELPWVDALEKHEARKGVMVRMPGPSGESRTLSVNAIPILGGDGTCRGAMATFDDVTAVEQKNLELAEMLAALRESRDAIERQNRELHRLATYDPLTRCLNRRSFFEQFETLWSNAGRYGYCLSLVMVDIDHFKSINDRFGHTVGDLVLKQVGETLRAAAREGDLVCRYGGEEFCILLFQQDSQQGLIAAERYRRAIAAMPFDDLQVTASFGVATSRGSGRSPQELLVEADRALYAAKHGGRNRVVPAEELPAATVVAGAAIYSQATSFPAVPQA